MPVKVKTAVESREWAFYRMGRRMWPSFVISAMIGSFECGKQMKRLQMTLKVINAPAALNHSAQISWICNGGHFMTLLMINLCWSTPNYTRAFFSWSRMDSCSQLVVGCFRDRNDIPYEWHNLLTHRCLITIVILFLLLFCFYLSLSWLTDNNGQFEHCSSIPVTGMLQLAVVCFFTIQNPVHAPRCTSRSRRERIFHTTKIPKYGIYRLEPTAGQNPNPNFVLTSKVQPQPPYRGVYFLYLYIFMSYADIKRGPYRDLFCDNS
jgi:hypothetical protein